jgi:NAD(P)-dependent dehydrogenase (short-subunit alcohol dehydrogenase family)
MRRALLVLASAWLTYRAVRRVRRQSLAGKVVVVCGGSRGLGRALAGQLVQRGARVAICARSAEPLARTERWLSEQGGSVLAQVCDLRYEGQTSTFFRRVEQQLGPIDVVIVNAATIDVGPLEALAPPDFDAAMSEIFGSAVRATLTALPAMRERRTGTIALISSIGGRLGVPHLAPYSSAKFAVVGFAEALHAEVARDGVRVLTVLPGLMRTGSHVRARFRGKAASELGWFGAMAMTPLLSIDADRAARRIVRAIERGDRYLTFTPAARLGAWVHDAAPGIWSLLASLSGRLLPRSPAGQGRFESYEGRELTTRSRWLSFLARRARPLTERYGQ